MQQKYIEANNAYIDLQTIPNDERLGIAQWCNVSPTIDNTLLVAGVLKLSK